MTKISDTKKNYMWHTMKNRCYNAKWQDENGKHYRGHTVCKEWLEDMYAFYDWVDEHYYQIHGVQIDLDHNVIDVHNTVYTPDKCLFVPHDVNVFFEHIEPGIQIRQLKNGTYSVSVTSKLTDPNYDIVSKLFKECPAETWNDALAQFVVRKTLLRDLYLDKYYGRIPKDVYDIIATRNIAQINRDKFRYDESGKVPVYINGEGSLVVNYDTGEYWWDKAEEYRDLAHRIG